MKTLLCFLFSFIIGFTAMAQAPATADMQQRLKAAGQLLDVMNIENQINESLKATLDLQIQQQPQLAQFRDVMEAFFKKHFNYSTIKEPLAGIYADAFTEKELNDLIAFYKTPTGQKSAQKQSELMQKGMMLGQQAVQQNLPELQQMIVERMQELEKKP